MIDSDLLLAVGSRLVHIGPPKTGTTEIQSALHASRDKLLRWGVVYPGRRPQVGAAALAVTGAKGPPGIDPKPAELWDELVGEVSAAGDARVVVSSEFIAASDDAMAARITDELGGERVHIVITLRPLDVILPSAWQQFVRHGLRVPYQRWLRYMLEIPPYENPTPSFWRHHRHDDLVDRWAGTVGAPNVTVLVADEADPRLRLRTFEAMLGLPEGLLVARDGDTNRSLTRAEAELVRKVNIRVKQAGWPDQLHRRLVRYGIVPALQTRTPSPAETPIRTPDWALERAAEIGAAAADRIAQSGVQVIGDLGVLRRRPAPPPRPDSVAIAHDSHEVMVRTSVAADAMMAALRAADVGCFAPQPSSPSILRRVKRRTGRALRRATRRPA